jgi:hypothetical protein
MSRISSIPELRKCVVDALGSPCDYMDLMTRQTLGSLARVSKGFSEFALENLWHKIYGFTRLVSLLPEDSYVVLEIMEGGPRYMVIPIPP